MKKAPPRNVGRRDVGPFLQWLRERFLGREVLPHLRFPDVTSDRTQDPPDLPDGPSHKLFGNYYYMRDARRRMSPPLYIAGPDEVKKITAGTQKEETYLSRGPLGVTPGHLYDPEVEPEPPIRDPAKLEKLRHAKS